MEKERCIVIITNYIVLHLIHNKSCISLVLNFQTNKYLVNNILPSKSS